jgi:poly(A) polymerase/tRNA nucleotidyltransferase (CCA-adding enzyme)
VKTRKILEILRKLERDTKAEIYFAGECARDLVRRKRPKDIEVLVKDLPLSQIAKYLKRHFKNVYVNSSSSSIEISSDSGKTVIRIPEKSGKFNPHYSLKDDSRCRVFSINALYIPLRKRKKIIDFHNGRSCIRSRKIKTISKPDVAIFRNSVVMMEALALCAGLNYKLDNNLFYAIKANYRLIEDASVEETRKAFNKILLSRKPSKYLRIMRDSGLMSIVLPELNMCTGVTQNTRYHKYDVFNHCVIACDNVKPDITLRLAALLHDIGKVQTREETVKFGKTRVTFYNHEVVSAKIAKKVLRRLKYDKEIVTAVPNLVYNHMYNYEPDVWTDAAVRRFISKADITEKDLDDLDNLPVFLIRKADRAANGLNLSEISPRQTDFEERIREVYEGSKALAVTDLDINGDILMKEFNLRAGPTIGHILHYLLSLVIEDQKLNQRKILIEEASKYLSKALK